jgi:3-deoxy-D-manno-octulosonate 8-phosphate phosphatase (KDO 8-P phosphatase)
LVTPAPQAPSELERRVLAERALRIRLVLTDCDGVLTDGGVYYSDQGEALKRFSMRDGMGVERLREAGIGTAIVTGEASACVARRSEKLGLPHLFLDVRDKRAHLSFILEETGLALSQLAYVGDDLNDLGILAEVGRDGITAAPADAMPDVRRAVHYHCANRGGEGAFRDFAEWLLRLRRAEDVTAERGMPWAKR